jgi:UDP-glucose 4-epimerase
VKNILITGANGLLARNLVRTLSHDKQVYVTTHNETVEILPNVQYIRLDLANEMALTNLPIKVDVVIHLAQSSRYRDFPGQALNIFAVNTAATAKLLDYAHRSGASQFIYFSTGGLYQPGSRVLDETSPLLPLDGLNYHFASKLAGEAIVGTYSALMNTVVVRPFFIYGQGQRRSMLIPRLVDQIKRGELISLDGREGIRLNPIHVADACSFVTHLLRANLKGIFNMAGPDVITIKDICIIIGQKLGIEPSFSHHESIPMDLISSTSKMTEIHCQPTIRFVDGIRDVLND